MNVNTSQKWQRSAVRYAGEWDITIRPLVSTIGVQVREQVSEPVITMLHLCVGSTIKVIQAYTDSEEKPSSVGTE